MTQDTQSINSYIEEYLDYYCGLSHPPEFAVLLKGQWGAGKTWFIQKYREKLERKNQKCLYVSLYGMTNLSEIEEKFFQLLHPILSSKGMAITGKILKGLLKGALKIDLNNDNSADGTVNVQIPEINLPDHLKNVDKSILIFDDLERCKIELNNVLGYINHFVENQGLKVIIVADEDRLLQRAGNDTSYSYKVIKEKLIGKTFTVASDFQAAFKDFTNKTNNLEAKELLFKNFDLIQDLYRRSEYQNLRSLKQIILDFERIFENLPEKSRSKPELLQDLLKLLIAFSIEIKRGNMLPKDLENLQNDYVSETIAQLNSKQSPSSVTEDKAKFQYPLQKMFSTYAILDPFYLFPSTSWWQAFFDKGIIDIKELEQSILSSRYFQDENTPDWMKLYHFLDLSDFEFDDLFKEVEKKYNNRQFLELGEIKHVFGLLLTFSDAEIYNKTKEEVLEDSKLYLDYLTDNEPSFLISPLTIEDVSNAYAGLGFYGKEFKEFKEFLNYISKARELTRSKNMPSNGRDLLDIMEKNVRRFYSMISLGSVSDEDVSIQKYHEVPILKYVEPSFFVERLLSIENFEHRQWVFWALRERYKFDQINTKLLGELEWLKSVRVLLLEEIDRRKGRVSGFALRRFVENYLNEIIEKLELGNQK
jgi:hypothetical protein